MGDLDQKRMTPLQEKCLKIAEYFVLFCEEHDLLCYLCGGGCIGAVRHGGFIPWDDDLDFFMPREDYEKLKRLWQDTEQFALMYPGKEPEDRNMFMTLRDKNTTLIKMYQADLDIVHGVNIDIFPLDGLPAGKTQRIHQVFWALVYQLFCTKTVPENHGKAIKWIGKIILSLFNNNTVRKIAWQFAEKQMSKYPVSKCNDITEICAGPKYMFNRYPSVLFASAEYMKFEDTLMPIPCGYDGYLKIAFGEYMILPPENLRIPQHDVLFMDLEHSYKTYYGIKYSVEKERIE